MPTRRTLRLAAVCGLTLFVAVAFAGCGPTATDSASGKISAVGAENEYANVIAQVGGGYVSVSAVESNPNTDPHSFEASPSVAETIAAARLVVQNGLGYDGYMEKLEAATGGAGSDASRKVIDVQRLLGLPDSTANPHLWYQPRTMPVLARAIAADLSAIQPSHAAYFRANARRFEASLAPWLAALRSFRTHHSGAAIAVTEPVGDYMLEAAGAKILTPTSLQADVMNGTDPAPQDVSFQQGLLSGKRVEALVYNQQVTDPLTESFLATAASSGVPVVGVYETMPAGYDYQSWMLAELRALERAVSERASTKRL